MAAGQTRELDEATADAVALMTLFVSATEADEARADDILDELLTRPDGCTRSVAGFETLCGVLLILLEADTGMAPTATLQKVGAMVALGRCS